MTLEHHSYYTTVKIEIQPLISKSKDLLIYIKLFFEILRKLWS